MATKIQHAMPSLGKTSATANGSIPLIETSIELQDMPRHGKTQQVTQPISPTSPSSETMDAISNYTTNNSKPSYIDLFTNGLFLSRILILLITMFCFILSLFYTLGQILSLQLSEFWCPKTTIEEVHANSKAKNLNGGQGNACWRTKLFVVNSKALWSSESYDFEWEFQDKNILKFTGFMVITVILLVLIIIYIYRLVSDTILYRKQKLGKKRIHKRILTKQQISLHKTNKTQKSQCCVFVYKLYETYWKLFHTDSGLWCAKKLLTEIFELFVQTTALLYYNGYQLLSSPNDDEVILAYKSEYIILFATFLSINSMFAGITWLLYVVKPLFCHGFIFEVVVYSTDVVFDIFYTLFPLIVVLRATPNIFIALGSLQTDDQITFWAAFIPLSFLCWSSYSFSRTARNAMTEYYGTQFLSSHLSQRTPNIKSINLKSSSKPANATHIANVSSTLQKSISFVISSDVKKHQIIRKTFLIIICLIFSIYSIVLLSLVISHFNEAIPYCSSVVNELNNVYIPDIIISNSNSTSEKNILSSETRTILDQHPELFLYNYCEFSVYPFQWDNDGNTICECRKFKTDLQVRDFVWDVQSLKKYFNLTLIDIGLNVLLKWKMLERFAWRNSKQIYRKSGIETMPFFNLTKNMFGAKKLRVISIGNSRIGYIDEAISNWKMLVYMQFSENDYLKTVPQSIGKLTELRYLEISNSRTFSYMPDSVCKLSKLRSIDLELSAITKIQHCISDLPNLQSVILSGMVGMDSLPITLFNHPNLNEISAVHSIITVNSLIEYNNFNNFSQFDAAFQYSTDKTYWFEKASFCSNLSLIPINSNFYKFINDTKCCNVECKASNAFGAFTCQSYDYNDGICDDQCKNSKCNFDGGDCVQLCDCDPFNELGNGVCDKHCNTSECLYDGYDCLPLGYDLIECELSFDTYGCNTSWIGDGWCDLNCLNSNACGNDLEDCNGCNNKKGTQCSTIYEIFDVVANSQTNDNMVNEIELQNMWELGVKVGAFDPNIYKNASQVISVGDLNNDKLLDLKELIIVGHDVYGVKLEKALQIDCSKCLK
eukprot:443068_1